ncbi:hypothetical protein VNO80_02927 [Phaseolus coccineus]|uniref:Uncharacterized protein n=1 Tax=Phaseolus coccineus TaxID=3886 RepID=A0AAN9NR35_PHACN
MMVGMGTCSSMEEEVKEMVEVDIYSNMEEVGKVMVGVGTCSSMEEEVREMVGVEICSNMEKVVRMMVGPRIEVMETYSNMGEAVREMVATGTSTSMDSMEEELCVCVQREFKVLEWERVGASGSPDKVVLISKIVHIRNHLEVLLLHKMAKGLSTRNLLRIYLSPRPETDFYGIISINPNGKAYFRDFMLKKQVSHNERLKDPRPSGNFDVRKKVYKDNLVWGEEILDEELKD